jgi:hypothetical protein
MWLWCLCLQQQPYWSPSLTFMHFFTSNPLLLHSLFSGYCTSHYLLFLLFVCLSFVGCPWLVTHFLWFLLFAAPHSLRLLCGYWFSHIHRAMSGLPIWLSAISFQLGYCTFLLWDFVSSRPECCLSHLCIPFLIMYATFYNADYSVASLFLLCTSQLFWLHVPVALFPCCTCSFPVVLLKHQVIQYTWHSYVLIVENAVFFLV